MYINMDVKKETEEHTLGDCDLKEVKGIVLDGVIWIIHFL